MEVGVVVLVVFLLAGPVVGVLVRCVFVVVGEEVFWIGVLGGLCYLGVVCGRWVVVF